jgi:hypothetical protein
MAMQMSNDLGLPPIAPSAGGVNSSVPRPAPVPDDRGLGLQMEFAFELPKGYLDGEGNLHRKGIMRLAKAIDEIVPMRDPRVQSNPAYATVLILARVITRLGALHEVSPLVIEGLFACDLDYLQKFYRQINELET